MRMTPRIMRYHPNGLKSFVEYINEDKKVLHNVLDFEGSKDLINVEVALQYNDSYSENIIKYNAASPDEMSLVNFARSAKFVFKGKNIEGKIWHWFKRYQHLLRLLR